MISVLLKALQSIVTKLLAALATEVLLEWTLFKVAELLVAKTKTPHDDEWLAKFKESYYSSK